MQLWMAQENTNLVLENNRENMNFIVECNACLNFKYSKDL